MTGDEHMEVLAGGRGAGRFRAGRNRAGVEPLAVVEGMPVLEGEPGAAPSVPANAVWSASNVVSGAEPSSIELRVASAWNAATACFCAYLLAAVLAGMLQPAR